MRVGAAAAILVFLTACPADEPSSAVGSAAHGLDLLTPDTIWFSSGGPVEPSELGWVTTRAGDLDGNGYDDLAVSAIKEGASGHGSVHVFAGGPNGYANTPTWSLYGADEGNFGAAVAGVGDLDGDLFDDLVVGEPGYGAADEGRVHVFLGTGGGVSSPAARIYDGSQESDAETGLAVAGVGDLNGDGLADFVVGEPGVDSASGPGNEGRLQIFHGSMPLPALYSPDAVISGDLGEQRLGTRLAALGDVSGDGHPDLLAANESWNLQSGRVELYLGDGLSLNSTSPQFVEGNTAGELLGASIAGVGDISGDGFADVVVGAPGFLDNSNPVGRIYLLGGSSNSTQPLQSFGNLQGNLGDSQYAYGAEVGALGDVNGDGYADIFVSREDASATATNFGEVVYSDPSGGEYRASFGDCALSVARGVGADADGDGFPELYVGAVNASTGCSDASPPGRIDRHTGHGEGLLASESFDWGPYTGGDMFGTSLGTTDFNGDGYDDVIVGAPQGGTGDAGEVLVYFGAAFGVDTTPDVELDGPAGGPGDNFGWSVAGLNDVNGDGYGDVVVGALGRPTVSAGAFAGEAFLFPGSPLSNSAGSPAVVPPSGAPIEGQMTNEGLGTSVASAGDVDADGLDEVVIGSPGYDLFRGRAQVCSWNPAAAGLVCTWVQEGENADDEFGFAVSGGDVNGDGFSDVLVGAPGWDDTSLQNVGRVRMFQGATDFETGPPAAVPIFGETAEGRFGTAVSFVGDVNGDFFGDVLVGSPEHFDTETDEGLVTLLVGNGVMPMLSPDWSKAGGIAQRNLGGTLAGGDFNGDGYADLVFSSATASPDGQVDVAYGLSTTGLLGENWLLTGVGATGSGLTTGDYNGDGYDDLFVGNSTDGPGSMHGFPGNRGETGAREVRPTMLRVLRLSGTTVSVGGAVGDDQVEVELLARSVVGPTRAALLIELQPWPQPFTGIATHSGGLQEVNNFPTVNPLSLTVTGLAVDTPYRVQARLEYDRGSQGVQRYSPWVVPGGAGNLRAVHFRRGPSPSGDDDDATGDDDDSTANDDDSTAPDDDDSTAPDDDDSTADDDDSTAPDDDDSTAPDDDDTAPDDDDSNPDDDDSAPDDDDSVPDDDDSTAGNDEDNDGWKVEDGDCNDNNSAIHPGAPEVCNGLDDDCDGDSDEPEDIADDFDGDGWGGCTPPVDCEPYNPLAYPGAVEYCDGLDNDCVDGGDEADSDGDGVRICAGDCDDGNADRFPGNPEVCGDGVDQDCNGSDTDSDDDGDGFSACADGDCDDQVPSVHPGAIEVCDGHDNDCDGVLFPGDEDDDSDLFPNCNDCNPSDPAIHPGAEEICNGFDDDCDGFALGEGEFDFDGDGFLTCQGDCSTGLPTCEKDCDDSNPDVNPWEAEDCTDGIDNNCNDEIDEDVDADEDGQTTCEGDCRDNDNSFNSLNAVELCDGFDNDCSGVIDDGPDEDGDGSAVCDCDPEQPTVYPGAPEICGDGLNNSCDPYTDELNDVDVDGDGFFICPPIIPNGDCADGNVLIHPNAREVCDGIDNNCDGGVDETYDADADEWLSCRFDCDDGETPVHPGGIEICHNGIDEDCDGDPDELCPDPVRVVVPPGHACTSCGGGGSAALFLPLLWLGRRRRR